MPVDRSLLKILCCPKCKGGLYIEENEISFVCQPCRMRYPIADDIPNFLVAEAEQLTEEEIASRNLRSIDAL